MLVILVLGNAAYAGEKLWLAAISVDEAARKVRSGQQRRVLSAKTQVIDGKKVHIVKSLTPDGRIQYHKFDAQTGLLLDSPGVKQR